ncbi:MAG: discoidin domain-containing protein [Elusimicrobiota bacterium]
MRNLIKKYVLITAVLAAALAISNKAHCKIIDDFEKLNNWKSENPEVKLKMTRGIKGFGTFINYKPGDSQQTVMFFREIIFLDIPDDYRIGISAKGDSLNCDIGIELIDLNENSILFEWQDITLDSEWKDLRLLKKNARYSGKITDKPPAEIKKIKLYITAEPGAGSRIYLDELIIEPVMPGKIKGDTLITSSSSTGDEYSPDNAFDGDMKTKWLSRTSQTEWISIDMGVDKQLLGLIIYRQDEGKTAYNIEVSTDNVLWNNICSVRESVSSFIDINFIADPVRYLRIVCLDTGEAKKHEIDEIVFKTPGLPYGKYMKDPDIFFKNRWDLVEVPEKVVYIPKSWEGSNMIMCMGRPPEEFSVSLNDRPLAKIGTITRKPVVLHIKKLVECGECNIFRISTHTISGNDTDIDIMFFAKDRNSIEEYLDKLKSDSAESYYEFIEDLYPEGIMVPRMTGDKDFFAHMGNSSSPAGAVITENGTVAPAGTGYFIIPYIYMSGRLLNYSDFERAKSLTNGYIPIPVVIWLKDGMRFEERLFYAGSGKKAANYLWVKLANTSEKDISGSFYLAFRPAYISAELRDAGKGPVSSIEYTEDTSLVIINSRTAVGALVSPSAFGANAFDDGDIVETLNMGKIPEKMEINDEKGFASAVLAYDFNLPPQSGSEYIFVIPEKYLPGGNRPPDIGKTNEIYTNLKNDWKTGLNRISIRIPEKKLPDLFRSNLAQTIIDMEKSLFISRQENGALPLNPVVGTGLLYSLLAAGYPEVCREYLETIVGDGLKNDNTDEAHYGAGKRSVPDEAALVYSIFKYYEFTGDRKFAGKMMPHALKSLRYIEEHKRKEAGGLSPEKRDTLEIKNKLWRLTAWKAGARLAETAGAAAEVITWINDNKIRLLRDIEEILVNRQSDPEAALLAVFPAEEYANIKSDLVKKSLYRYNKKEQDTAGTDSRENLYDHTDFRLPVAYLLSGNKEEAHNMFNLLTDDMVPAGWNRWDPTQGEPAADPLVSAMIVRFIRSIFVYEQKYSIVLGAGIKDDWINADTEISVEDMPACFGKVSYRLSRQGEMLTISVTGDAAPPEGFAFKLPLTEKVIAVSINKLKTHYTGDSTVYFRELPVDIEIEFGTE